MTEAALSSDSAPLRLGFQADNIADGGVQMMVYILDLQDRAPSIERLRQWALDSAHPQRGQAVVDVGCGTGTMIRRLADLVGPAGSATGVDPNPKLRAVAASRTDVADSVNYVDGTAGSLPVADASVDLLWCERVLQHVADAQAAVDEFARVLRPGGTAVILDSDHASRVTSDIDFDVEETLLRAALDKWPNPRAARNLPRQIATAGLVLEPDIGSSALVLTTDGVQLLRAAAAAAVDDGDLDQSHADSAVARFAAAAERGHAFTAVTVFGFVARKPRLTRRLTAVSGR